MAKADHNNLRKSAIESSRQQRQEQPKVGGASGTPPDASPEAAEVEARKRRGKTKKHVSEDTPV